MRQPIEVITAGSDKLWKHINTGDLYRVVFACPREVIAVGAHNAWIGHANRFTAEFYRTTKFYWEQVWEQ